MCQRAGLLKLTARGVRDDACFLMTGTAWVERRAPCLGF